MNISICLRGNERGIGNRIPSSKEDRILYLIKIQYIRGTNASDRI